LNHATSLSVFGFGLGRTTTALRLALTTIVASFFGMNRVEK